jgi:hypothetical protein
VHAEVVSQLLNEEGWTYLAAHASEFLGDIFDPEEEKEQDEGLDEVERWWFAEVDLFKDTKIWNKSCPICFEYDSLDGMSAILLCCGHVYCPSCYKGMMEANVPCCPTCRFGGLRYVQEVIISDPEGVGNKELEEEEELDQEVLSSGITFLPFIGPRQEGEVVQTELAPKKKQKITASELSLKQDDEDLVKQIFNFIPANKVWNAHKWLKELSQDEREAYLKNIESCNRSVERMVFETMKFVKPLTTAEVSC